MDTLNWDSTPIISTASSSWKNQQRQINESLVMSNSYRFAPNVFNPTQLQLGDNESSQCRDIDDTSTSLAMNLQEFGAAFDPIDILSSWKISQRQEAATRLAADSVAAKLGDRTKMGSSSFPPQNKYMPNYFGNNQLAVCGLISRRRSLDCLLSATNTSNTDTSVEDDGISVIFSDDSRSLWNVNTDNAVSAAESAIHANYSNNIPRPVNDLDETVSPTCSYHLRNITMRSSEAKPYMAKRSHDQALLNSATDSSTKNSGVQIIPDIPPMYSKRPRSENKLPSSSNINFQQASSSGCSVDEPDSEAIAEMKEITYRAAALRPVSSFTEVVEKKPKRKNLRISTDPQTAAARRRRERISERIRVLQKLVPGGSKMDTASMLDEAANYLKFLRTQVNALEAFGCKIDPVIVNNSFSSLYYPFPMQPHFPPLNLNPIQRSKC